MAEPKLKHISVGKDGSIWTVGQADGTIFRLFGDAGVLGWVADKGGKADVIAAVDWGNAWCVNKAHKIWRLVDAENIDRGGTWTEIPTHSGKADARTISVGADGSVWYAQTDGTLFVRENNTWKQDSVGKATVVAAISKVDVWCVNQAHEIYHLQSGTWTKVQTHSGKADAKTISVGSDGSAWYAQTDGTLFVRENNAWKQDPVGKATVVAAVSKVDVWCVNQAHEVHHLQNGTWHHVREIGPNGNTWTYTVQEGDGLMAIVRKAFNLKDPKDTPEINRVVNLIVAQNLGHIPHLTRDLIKKGDVLTLHQ